MSSRHIDILTKNGYLFKLDRSYCARFSDSFSCFLKENGICISNKLWLKTFCQMNGIELGQERLVYIRIYNYQIEVKKGKQWIRFRDVGRTFQKSSYLISRVHFMYSRVGAKFNLDDQMRIAVHKFFFKDDRKRQIRLRHFFRKNKDFPKSPSSVMFRVSQGFKRQIQIQDPKGRWHDIKCPPKILDNLKTKAEYFLSKEGIQIEVVRRKRGTERLIHIPPGAISKFPSTPFYLNIKRIAELNEILHNEHRIISRVNDCQVQLQSKGDWLTIHDFRKNPSKDPSVKNLLLESEILVRDAKYRPLFPKNNNFLIQDLPLRSIGACKYVDGEFIPPPPIPKDLGLVPNIQLSSPLRSKSPKPAIPKIILSESFPTLPPASPKLLSLPEKLAEPENPSELFSGKDDQDEFFSRFDSYFFPQVDQEEVVLPEDCFDPYLSEDFYNFSQPPEVPSLRLSLMDPRSGEKRSRFDSAFDCRYQPPFQRKRMDPSFDDL